MTLRPCEFCELLTNNEEDEYGQFVCNNCEQNKAEEGWERFCSDFYGGGDPLTIREKHESAFAEKRRRS